MAGWRAGFGASFVGWLVGWSVARSISESWVKAVGEDHTLFIYSSKNNFLPHADFFPAAGVRVG